MAGSDDTGLRGLLGSVARALGTAFVDSIERQGREKLARELSSPDIRTRKEAAERLRAVLDRPEFEVGGDDREAVDAIVRDALTSASAARLPEVLGAAVGRAQWRPMQRLMFTQLVAPNPNVEIRVGAAMPELQEGAPVPHLRLVTAEEPAEPADDEDDS